MKKKKHPTLFIYFGEQRKKKQKRENKNKKISKKRKKDRKPNQKQTQTKPDPQVVKIRTPAGKRQRSEESVRSTQESIPTPTAMLSNLIFLFAVIETAFRKRFAHSRER